MARAVLSRKRTMIHIARNYKTVGLASMTVGLCLLSFLLARGATKDDLSRFEKGLSSAHQDLTHGLLSKTSDGADKAVSLSEKAVGNRTYTRAVAADVATRAYSSDDPKAAVHLQILLAMQNQKMIEQNERIIRLLENKATSDAK